MLICRRLSWLGLVLLVGLPIPLHADVPPEERAKAFEWFDGLGLPDIREAQCVRVATGWWSRSGDDAPINTYQLGFLLEEEKDQFTALFTDLTRGTFTKTPPETNEHERVGYEKVELKEAAEAWLKELQTPVDEDARRWNRFGERMPVRTELFVMARVCAAAGHDELAARLCDFAIQHNDGRSRDRPNSLKSALAQDISHASMWQAVLDFENPSVTRPQLLEKFRWIVKHFPDSKHTERAGATADLLTKMVKEDEAHAKSAQPLDKLEGKQRVAELIFQLRDQNGQQWSQPGSCDIFADPREDESPAHQLVAIGYDAVPQLIEALDDERFTRSVGYHRNFYFSHHVLRVGDAALAVLETIAGRRFYQRTNTNAEAVKDGQAQTLKKAALVWWAEFEKKGEKQVLIDAVSQGGKNAVSQAQRLVKKYPDAAIPAIVQGLAHAKDAWTRSGLVEQAGELKGDGAIELLRRELETGKELSTRLAAATALHRQGKTGEAVDAMIAQWREGGRPDDDDRWTGQSLIGFLASSGQVRAIDALAADLNKRPVDVRTSVVSTFGSGNFSFFSTGAGLSAGPGEQHQRIDKKVEDAIENLLATALADTERRIGMSMTWNGASFTEPQVCDLAAFVLSQRWPERYKFDSTVSSKQRERTRLEMLNVWRKARGKDPIDLPELVTIPPVPATEIDPLIEQWLAARDGGGRAQAAAAIEAVGLGALPAVWHAARADPVDVDATRGLRELSQRLSNIVREIVVAQDSVEPDDATRKRLDALNTKPLGPDGLIDFVVHTLNDLPEGATGLSLRAERDTDGTGFVLTVKLTSSRDFQTGSQKGWSTHFNVQAAGKNLGNSSGSSSLEHGRSREAYKDVARTLNTALASDPYAEIAISMSAVLEK